MKKKINSRKVEVKMKIRCEVYSIFTNKDLIINFIKDLINCLKKDNVIVHNAYYIEANFSQKGIYHEVIIDIDNENFNKFNQLMPIFMSEKSNYYDINTTMVLDKKDYSKFDLFYEDKDDKKDFNDLNEKFSNLRRIVILDEEE